MSSKTLVMFGLVIGSFVGGYIPTILGASFFSSWSLLGNLIGAGIGIWITYKIVS